MTITKTTVLDLEPANANWVVTVEREDYSDPAEAPGILLSVGRTTVMLTPAEARELGEALVAACGPTAAAPVDLGALQMIPCVGCGDSHYPAQHTPECTERCPHCGSEGPDLDHCEGCPTIGTCAQTEPTLPPPWHRDEDWQAGRPFTLGAIREHIRTAHPEWRP